MKKNHTFFGYKILLVALFIAVGFLLPKSWIGIGAGDASAATYTVCASGCDFTTISAAFGNVGVVSGDTIIVSSTYSSSTEAYPILAPSKNLTVDCQNNGAIIGTSSAAQATLNVPATSTIQNCLFSNIQLAGNLVRSITITGNTFVTGTTSTIDLTSVNNFTISNNNYVNGIKISGGDTGTISNNSMYVYRVFSYDGLSLQIENGASNITVTSNTFSNYVSRASSFTQLVWIGNPNDGPAVSNVTISSNTINFPVTTDKGGVAISLGLGSNVLISGNYITSDSAGGGISGVSIDINPGGGSVSAIIDHNTLLSPTNSSTPGIFNLFSLIVGSSATNTTAVTTTYNIFYNSSSTCSSCTGIAITAGTSTFNFHNDYNGFWRMNSDLSAGSTGKTLGSNTRLLDPYFKTKDADTTNNLQLVPFSNYLDVNGTNDIGAYSASRRNTIQVTAGGTIDYSSVDATSTQDAADNVRTSDTINIAAGTYNSTFNITTSTGLGGSMNNITVAGSGAILSVGGTNNALSLNTVSSSNFSGLIFQNASSSQYSMTNGIFTYSGTAYDDDIGSGPNRTTIITSGASCSVVSFNTDGYDVTTHSGSPIVDWHLALSSVGANKITILVPNSYAASAAALTSLCSGQGLTVDRWVTSTFSASNGDYTYNSSSVAAAGVTVTGGFTDPPRIDRNRSAGIKLTNSSNNTFTTVTSTNNGNGIWFSGTSSGNAVSSSIFSNSASKDVYSDSSASSSLYNSSFTRASSTITGVGNVNVYFRARAFVTMASGTPLVAVTTTFKDSSITATTTLYTGSNGYTGYTDNMFAYVLSSSSIAETNGGYNPFTVVAAATGTYGAQTTSTNLNTVNQTFTLANAAAVVTSSTAPTGLATTTIGTSTVGLTWVDNSSGTGQEANFILDYVTSTNSFPGVTSSIAQNSTSTTVTGLLPNTLYTFRIAAQNASGTSAYSTTTAFYTLALPASAPTVTANGTSSLAITVNSGGNNASTTYAIYNSTSGTYLGSTGVATTTPVFQTLSAWTPTSATGLSINTPYQFSVIARNGDNVNAATSSLSTSTYTYANQPGAPTVTALSTTTIGIVINVNGNPTSTEYAHFNFTSSTYLLASGAATTSAVWQTTSTWGANFAATGLICGTSYSFKTIARNGNNIEAATSTASATSTSACPTTVPSAPSGFVTTSIGTSTVGLTWVDNSSGGGQETNFILDYVTSTNSFPGVTTSIAQNATSTTITGLTPNTRYTIRLAATNSAGTSSYVTTTAFYTLALPAGTPTVGTATTSTLPITINDGGNNASTTFAIYNATAGTYLDSTGAATTTAVFQVSSSWSGISAIGLSVNTSYQFSVIARNGDNVNSATSSLSTAKYTLAFAPGTPTIGTAAQTSLPITINVNSNPSNTEYAIYNTSTGNYLAASGASNGSTPIWQTTSTWGSSFSATGLTCANSYSFIVVARNGNNIETVSSTAASGTTSACSAPASASSGGGGGGLPPAVSNATVTINNGATTTQSISVNLTLTASGAAQMLISNDSTFVGSTWEPFVATKAWILKPGVGLKTVYVIFRDASNIGVDPVSDSIELVATQTTVVTTTPPVIQDQPVESQPTIPVCTPRFQISSDPTANIFIKQLAYGAREAAVKTLQNLLGNLGYFKFSYTTNNFISYTRDAVRAFQKAECLTITGITNQETRLALNSVVDQNSKYHTTVFKGKAMIVLSTAPKPTASTVIFRSYLYLGSSGLEVRALQQKLKDLGFFTHPTITGYFGPVTRTAVIDFQKAHNLTPYPGWVGPGTRAALNQ